MIKKLLLPILLIAAGLIGPGCKKNSSGPPSITGIRLIDPTKKDSLFTSAVPGTEIVIQGNNLDGAQKIFFNDTSAFFNPVYNTNSNIIVVIPNSAPTAAATASIPSTIRIITDHGTASYSFTLYLHKPAISSITFDNTGTFVTINGTDFQGISKITFPVPGNDTALSYTVNNTFTQIIAAIPPGSAFTDSLRVFCHYGTASFPYPPPMSISSVSNENAVAGTTLIINGTNLIGVKQVIFPGGIQGTNIQSVSVTQLSVTVPSGIASPDSLRIQGVLGNATAPQLFDSYITHLSPGYLCTFESPKASDNTGYLDWTGGYAQAPATNYPNATGSVALFSQGSPMQGRCQPGTQGNGGFIQLNAFPWVSNTGASVADYSLKFEIYVAKPWKAGAIWIMMGGWYGWHNYLARYAPWSTTADGVFQPSGWVTATIPLTQLLTVTGSGTSVLTPYNGGNFNSPNGDNNEWDFKTFPTGGVPANKFSDYPSTVLCFTITNDQTSPDIPANTLDIAIDNVRIVKGQ